MGDQKRLEEQQTNMTRKRIVAGNWKMNTDLQDGYTLMKDIVSNCHEADLQQCEVMIFPPFIHLKTFVNTINGSGLVLGAQNCHYAESGAYTGEISVPMLMSLPVEAVILGHSERRQYFNESNESVGLKAAATTQNGLRAIVCCGETLEQREAGDHFEIVADQVNAAITKVDANVTDLLVIAYEPVWAIGTGVTASVEQAQEMHKHIRKLLATQYGQEAADEIRILYGGSVKPNNAAELFGQEDIDGGLIGGASLKSSDFLNIIRA